MNIIKCALFWLSSSRSEEETSFLFAYAGETIHWNFSRPLLLFGIPNYMQPRNAKESPPLVCFKLKQGCGHFEVCGESIFTVPVDSVELFERGEEKPKWLHRIRFLWSGDGKRVILELDDTIVAAADLSQKRMIAVKEQPRRSFSRRWSKEGYAWDDTLLDEFDTVPDGMPPLQAASWWNNPNLSPGQRYYCFFMLNFWVFALPLALLMIYLEIFTPWQGIFFYFWLRAARNMTLDVYRPPYALILESYYSSPTTKKPKRESLWRDTPFLRHVLSLAICTAAMPGVLPVWLACAMLFWLFCYWIPRIGFQMVFEALFPKQHHKATRRNRENALGDGTIYAWRGGIPGLALGHFFAEHYSEKQVVIGLSRRQLDEEEKKRQKQKNGDSDDEKDWRTIAFQEPDLLLDPLERKLKESSVELVKIPDGFTATELDHTFGAHPEGDCLLSPYARYHDWTQTELWKTRSAAIFLFTLEPVDYREVFRKIRAGQLAGALIQLGGIPNLNWEALNPEPFHVFDECNKKRFFVVHRENVNALIDALVDAGHTAFAALQEKEEISSPGCIL